ncbi:hypothetical protein D3C87_1829390 [compost metagenome]
MKVHRKAIATAATVPLMNSTAPSAGLGAVDSRAHAAAKPASIMLPSVQPVAIQKAPPINTVSRARTPFWQAATVSR